MIIDDTNRDLVANNIYLSQRVGSLTARIKRLEEALRPFACKCGRHCEAMELVEKCARNRARAACYGEPDAN